MLGAASGYFDAQAWKLRAQQSYGSYEVNEAFDRYEAARGPNHDRVVAPTTSCRCGTRLDAVIDDAWFHTDDG